MSYFVNFPTIKYDIGKDGTEIELTDILRGASVRDELKANTSFYIRYEYKDTDRPEFISFKLYDNAEFHWLIMQMNDVVDPYYDLPISENGLTNYVDSKYPGQTFFMNTLASDTYVTLTDAYKTDEYIYSNDVNDVGDITGGDFIGTNRIKLDESASSEDGFYNGAVVNLNDSVDSQLNVILDYNGSTKWATLRDVITLSNLACGTGTFEVYPTATVHRWDASFSRLEATNIFGTFDDGDEVTGLTSGTVSRIERKVFFSKSAVHHFENPTTRVWLNPRGGTIEYLAGYIMDTSNGVVEAAVVTNEAYERTVNDSKRFVNLIDPSVLPLAVGDFRREINA